MLFHVARTGCFEFVSYTVTPQTYQMTASADAPDRSLSGGSDLSGSAHESAHCAAGGSDLSGSAHESAYCAVPSVLKVSKTHQIT